MHLHETSTNEGCIWRDNVFKVTSCWAFFVLREEMSSKVPEKPGGLVVTLGIKYG